MNAWILCFTAYVALNRTDMNLILQSTKSSIPYKLNVLTLILSRPSPLHSNRLGYWLQWTHQLINLVLSAVLAVDKEVVFFARVSTGWSGLNVVHVYTNILWCDIPYVIYTILPTLKGCKASTSAPFFSSNEKTRDISSSPFSGTYPPAPEPWNKTFTSTLNSSQNHLKLLFLGWRTIHGASKRRGQPLSRETTYITWPVDPWHSKNHRKYTRACNVYSITMMAAGWSAESNLDQYWIWTD